jgi:hypothetical protein
MNDKFNLIAFIAILLVIAVLIGMACIMAVYDHPVEAVGIGTAVSGLIGVLGTFRPRSNLEPSKQEEKDV